MLTSTLFLSLRTCTFFLWCFIEVLVICEVISNYESIFFCYSWYIRKIRPDAYEYAIAISYNMYILSLMFIDVTATRVATSNYKVIHFFYCGILCPVYSILRHELPYTAIILAKATSREVGTAYCSNHDSCSSVEVNTTQSRILTTRKNKQQHNIY